MQPEQPEGQPTNINEILRAQFDGAPAAAPEPDAPPAPPPGSVEPPPITIEGSAGVTATPPPPKPRGDDADARVAKIVAAQQQARAEHETRKREAAAFQLAEQERREYEEFKAMRARALEDPVGWAEYGGYKKPDEYAAAVVDKGALTPDRRRLLETEQRAIRAEQRMAQWEQQQQQRDAEQAYGQLRNTMQQIAQASGDTYDLIARSGSYDEVLHRINQHYKDTGEMLALEQGMELVEQELLDKRYGPVAESPKIRARYSSAPSGGQSAPSHAPAARSRGTQNLRATSSPQPQMSEAQSLEEAGKLLFGNMFRR